MKSKKPKCPQCGGNMYEGKYNELRCAKCGFVTCAGCGG